MFEIIGQPKPQLVGSAQQIGCVKSQFRQSRRPRKYGRSIFDRSKRPYRTVPFNQEERPL